MNQQHDGARFRAFCSKFSARITSQVGYNILRIRPRLLNLILIERDETRHQDALPWY